MSRFFSPALTRRTFLASAAASASGAMLPVLRHSAAQAAAPREVQLRAAPSRIRLLSELYGGTAAWSYNGTVPGPEIRVRQRERLRVTVENGLSEETTVHWHGVRGYRRLSFA
jgi:FtsP/CotA-like multicopper oxidase with cupredoxin domain